MQKVAFIRAQRCAVAVAGALLTLAIQAADLTPEQRDAEFAKLPWQQGPTTGKVGTRATITVPAKASLLPESSGARFLELTGNLPEPGDTILTGKNWWATFSFDPAGYIKDDEKLDPDALLKSIRDSDERGNEERRKRGISQLHTDGWIVPPHYDPETKYLEWGLKLHADDSPTPVINYSVRLLGRTGFESVVLVSTPETLQQDVAELKTMLRSFDFDSGEKYSEFKPGDHVAEFGLGALVLGGAAAAAVKSGLWKSILVALAAGWKLVAAGVVALLAGIGKFFKRKST